ncbi:MAG: hypothetical protein IJ557_02690 [Bacteroidaceae bacterium]|nr:hypothetical protein [Bacteroidaceae bacterium]
MIITTVEELRLHLPNHAYDDLDNMAGAFRRSEADVLKPKIGTELYTALIEKYQGVEVTQRRDWLVHEGTYAGDTSLWAELVYLCQQVVVFDAFMRNADINAISVNQSGINVVSAENYDAASNDGIEKYKQRLNKEMHTAVNQLLVWLEDLCKEEAVDDSNGTETETTDTGTTDASGNTEDTETGDDTTPTDGAKPSDKEVIINKWKTSKYYYKVAGLFISTATQMSEILDFYDSRERFVTLVPDIKFCQRHYITNELGIPLSASLLSKLVTGTGNKAEKEAILLAQEALCLCVESRNKMFNRPAAKDEAVGAVKMLVEYVFANIAEFDEDARKYFPKYEEAWAIHEAEVLSKEQGVTEPIPVSEPWVNNRKECGMFVAPTIC